MRGCDEGSHPILIENALHRVGAKGSGHHTNREEQTGRGVKSRGNVDGSGRVGSLRFHAPLICSWKNEPAMRLSTLLLTLPLLALFAIGCSGGDAASSDATDAGAAKESTRPAVQAKGKPSRKAYTEEELNRPYSTVSPWRYIATGPETQYFERLVMSSELARTVHGAGHTVLVPRDMTFTEDRTWKDLLEEENEEALDRFVRAHILVGLKSIKSLEGLYEDLNGNTVAIERNEMGQLVCGGARIIGQEVETDHGIVIPVVGMVEDIRWN